MGAPSVWLCPRCQRRVPRREDTCFCGCPREQAEREEQQQRQRSAVHPTRELAVTLVLIVLVVGLLARWLGQPAPPAPAAPPVPAATRPAPSPFAVRVIRMPDPAATPEAEATPPPPVAAQAAPAAQAPAPPAPAPHETPPSERAQAELRAAYAALQADVAPLERVLSDYQSLCLGTHVGVVVSNCDQMQAWLRENAQRVQEGLAAAEEQARRQRVLPGDVRALREELGVARWEELAGRARAAR